MGRGLRRPIPARYAAVERRAATPRRSSTTFRLPLERLASTPHSGADCNWLEIHTLGLFSQRAQAHTHRALRSRSAGRRHLSAGRPVMSLNRT